MKTFLTFALLALSLSAYSAEFVHPLDFKGSDAEKQQVIEFIQESIKASHESLGIDSASILRIAEQSQLDAFKALTQVQNRELLDKVIKSNETFGIDSYSIIKISYDQELKSSKEKLAW